MRQKHILVILLALLASVLQAATVNKEDALQKAQHFVAGRQAAARGGMGQTLSLQTAYDNSYFYVFNIGGNDGFVIVSGDDRTPEILGYSDAGRFDAQNIPDNMRAFLQGYADEIQHIPATATAASREVGQKRVASTRASISPLLTTRWNQRAPYYNSCPTGGSQHALTGCVATAMAQVMNYHKYPVAATAPIPNYGYGELPATTFNWDLMHNEYEASDNSDAAAEVAKLMQYCGYSVRMNYGIKSSNADTRNVVDALVNYFDYDGGAKYASRSDYGYNEWVSLIYNELVNGRPMVFGGQSTGGGHAFVCDGFDEDDFFHINWGWGGTSNGYFRLSNLTPESQGAGGSSSSDGYNLSLGAAIGVQPNTGTLSTGELLTVRNMLIMTDVVNNEAVTVTHQEYHRSYTSWNFYLGVDSEFWNNTGATRTFDCGWRLKKDGVTIVDKVAYTGTTVNSGTTTIPGQTFSFGANLEDGEYKIVAICKESGSDTWSECIDADSYYLRVVINGLDMTVDAVSNPSATYNLSVTGISGTNSFAVGQTQTITVSLNNSGGRDYHGDITVAFQYTENDEEKYSYFGGKTVDILAGQTMNVEITAAPSMSGTFTLNVYKGFFEKGTLLAYMNNVVVSGENVSADIAFSGLTIANSNDDTVYGNSLSGSVTVVNNDTKEYKQGITIALGLTYNWTDLGDGRWSYNYSTVGSKNVNDNMAAGEQNIIDFDFKGLEYGEQYILLLSYYGYNGQMVKYSTNAGIYTIAHGFVTIDADGNVTATAPAASVTIPADAVAVDLRGQSTVTNVSAAANTNPNIVYLLDEEATVPTGVTGNIVKGGNAEAMSIVDGSDFSTPIAIAAGTVSYTRTFTLPATAAGGWSTIVLPFDVDKVMVGDEEIDWFHSAEATNGRFWVRQFVSDGSGSVAFDYTDRIKANTPYIIAVPGNAWGEKWNLVGKEIVFKGTNKEVVSAKAVTSGNHYKFTGTTTQTAQTDVYTLNESGTTFVLGEATVNPFRAYFKTAEMAYATAALAITSPSSEATAIGQLPADIATPEAVYTLEGRRLTTTPKHGVYIKNGKKMVK